VLDVTRAAQGADRTHTPDPVGSIPTPATIFGMGQTEANAALKRRMDELDRLIEPPPVMCGPWERFINGRWEPAERQDEMALYEVAVLLKPTENEQKDGQEETLLLAPTAVVAKDDKTAAMLVAGREELKGQPQSRMKVLVRPFC
jgi:hypothetical protein